MTAGSPRGPGATATVESSERIRRMLMGEQRVRPPWTLQKFQFLLMALIFFGVLTPLAMSKTGVSPSRLITGAEQTWSLIQRMTPPDFVDWRRYVPAVIDTMIMVFAGTALAFMLAVPCAFLAARNTTTGPVAYAAARGIITAARSIPALVFALIFVRAFGIGPVAGIIALGINSIGMVGKLYADAIEESDPGPVRALESAGAGRLQRFAGGVLPQVLPTWIALILYRFDLNLRAAVIFGYVGVGGIGFELQRVQRQLVYDRVLAIVLIILVLIVAVELLSNGIRRMIIGDLADKENPFSWRARLRAATKPTPQSVRKASDRPADWDRPSSLLDPDGRSRPVRPPWTTRRRRSWAFAGSVLILTPLSLRHVGFSPATLIDGLPGLGRILSQMWPPDFHTNSDRVKAQLLETLWIAIAAVGMAMLICLPFGLLGARNVTPGPIPYRLARIGMIIERGIPDLVLAILFVVAVGLGPFAGVLALTIGAIGFTGKLMADQLENLPIDAARALEASGATWLQSTASGVLPQAMPGLIGLTIFSFDVFIRSATVLGIVGAGGIGGTINSVITQGAFDRLAAVVIVIFVFLYLVERFAGWLRARLI